MKQDFTIWRNQILQNPQNISPLTFGMSQDEIMEVFGKPDAVSTMRSGGKSLILKYHDIELHFDGKAHHGLYLIYSDDEIELSITAEHEEMLQPITNTEPEDNEFFLKDRAVYFSGLYENGLLKGVAPKDFCCWHYWGKSSTACFLGGIRLRGADPVSFRVLNYAYAMDKTAAYTTSGRVPDAELVAFQVLDNGQNESGAPQGYPSPTIPICGKWCRLIDLPPAAVTAGAISAAGWAHFSVSYPVRPTVSRKCRRTMN